MKTISTLFTSLFFTASVFAANPNHQSVITVKSASQREIQVVIDGKIFSPGKNIVMFGSPGLAKTMMQANLIDEYWLFVNPVLRGDGFQLFKPGFPQINLELKTSDTFDSGVIMLQYLKK